MQPELVLVVACGQDGAIGKDNQMPWHLPEDLKHLKAVTTGHTIIMGRKTYDSIGKPLPNRRSIVVSRQGREALGPSYAGAEIVTSLDAAIALSQQATSDRIEWPSSPIFVIGGAQLYQQALPKADRIELTEIDFKVEGADTFFPKLDAAAWDRQPFDAQAPGPLLSAKGLRYQFFTLRRKS